MLKVNTNSMVELSWSSPKGKFAGAGKEVSEALGRKPLSTDLKERHPFDVEILRIPPGKTPYPYHAHSAQWEFYHVISGKGVVRHKDGTTAIKTGDAFIFPPDEPHELVVRAVVDELVRLVGRKNERIDGFNGGRSILVPHDALAGNYVVKLPLRAVRVIRVGSFAGRNAQN